MKYSSLLALAAAATFPGSLSAEPLKKAEVTQIINQVGILQPGQGERPAAVNDVVEGKLGVRTGQKSRAELVFADETLTRLGANTIFNFEDGSRNMDLGQGTILLQVPKNAGGATIKTAAVTAAVTGTTILFEHTPAPVVPAALRLSEEQRNRKPHGYIKAMVLEGHLRVWLKNRPGESILLGPGQMLIMADDATEIPEPVDFDIETVVATSKLIDQAVWLQHKRRLELDLITGEILEQRKRKHSGDLIETNLLINGRGTKVVMSNDDERQHVKDSTRIKVKSISTPTPESTPASTPPATVTPTPSPTPTKSPTPSPSPTETPRPTPVESPSPTPMKSPSPSPIESPSPSPRPSPVESPSPTPMESPSPTPNPTPIPTPPPEDALQTFTSQGATNTINDVTPGNYDSTGNVTIVEELTDNSAGGTTVLPTEGDNFSVISNGGASPDGSPAPLYTGTKVTTTIPTIAGFAAAAAIPKSFVELDYRVLTNEGGSRGSNNDHVKFTITGQNGMEVSYIITRDQLVDADGLAAALARNNVGGYIAGTDWLTLKLELTPFRIAGDTSFTITVEDYDGNTGDTALAVDRYQITSDTSLPTNSNLIGIYSATFPEGVTFGDSDGEYRAPSLQGIENTGDFGPGSSGGVFNATTETGDLVVNAPILADTGINKNDPNNEGFILYGGEGGKVNLKSTQAAVQVNSTIQVASDDSESNRVSASGGEINVVSERSDGDGVVINNTGELLSLLNNASPGPGGKITIRAGDSNVLLNGGKVIATRGTVEITAPGAGRQITVSNAEIRGDVVKIGALGDRGQLIIGGGSISADTTLKLYGNASNGSVTFVADTTLNGANSQKIISANTVTVQDAVKVQVNGSAATVYTNNPNYTGSGGNGSTTGTFTNSGATTVAPPPF